MTIYSTLIRLDIGKLMIQQKGVREFLPVFHQVLQGMLHRTFFLITLLHSLFPFSTVYLAKECCNISIYVLSCIHEQNQI